MGLLMRKNEAVHSRSVRGFRALRICALALLAVSGSLWLAWAAQSTFQQTDWSGGLARPNGAILVLMAVGVVTISNGRFSGIFALVGNEGKQLIHAGVEGGKFLIHGGKLLVHGFETPVHFVAKAAHLTAQFAHIIFEAAEAVFDLLRSFINSVVDELEGNFLNRGVNEVFHMVEVYRIDKCSSNIFSPAFWTFPVPSRLDKTLTFS
jgi:hypothetical protein